VKIDKKITAIALAVALITSTGCQTAVNQNAGGNQNANTAVLNSNTAANTSTSVPAANALANTANTPTDAYKAAYAARKNKDVPALKKLLSKDILEFFTEISGLGEKKQTVDEMLMELSERPQAPTAEARNEKINGDKATIEYLDEKGEWSPMEFIKEDGGWKLTIEKPEPGAVDDGKDKKK